MAIKNNELTSFGIEGETQDVDDMNLVKHEQDHRKIATRTGSAQIYITDNLVVVSNGANGLLVNDRGTAVVNPFHIATDPSQTRINTFWVINDEIMTTLPSTVYTPIPMLRYKKPAVVDQISDLAKKISALSE